MKNSLFEKLGTTSRRDSFTAKSKTTINGLLVLFALLLMNAQVSWGQITEGFETGMPTTYTGTGAASTIAADAGTDTTLGSGTWKLGNVIRGTTRNSGAYSAQIKSSTGACLSTPVITNGVGTVTFWAAASSSSSAGVQLQISTDGGTSYTQVGSTYTQANTFSVLNTFYQISAVINNPGTNIRLRWYRTASTIYIDDVSITATSTTWTTAWSNGAPTASLDAIIAGAYSAAANITAKTLTVNNSAVATIPTGNNVTVTGAVTVTAPATLTFSNNANLIQDAATTVNANSGAITVIRDSNALYRLDYTMWSSPVDSQNLLAFSPLTNATRFYTYNPSTNLYNTVVSPSTTPFAAANGYLIRMPNEDPSNLGGGSAYALGTATLTYDGAFTGLPNNGDVSVTGLTSSTYNAVGNPYPSTISADAFINGNSTDGTLYFWRKTNAGTGTAYATYNLVGITVTAAASGNGSGVPDGTVAVGQGFIVKTGVAATTLDFTNAMRTTNNSAPFFKTRNTVERNRVWVNLTNTTGVFSQMLVAYMTDATQGVDAGIDGKYINDSAIALNSFLNNEEFVIQGRSLPFDGTDVVPLAFKTDLAGEYTIAIDHVDGLFSGSQAVFLKDNSTGIETDLKAGAYAFTAAAGVDNARFSLKYQKTLGINASVFNDNSVAVYKNKGTIHIKSSGSTIDNVKIYDISGRLIFEKSKVNANDTTIESAKLGNQVLIVEITSENQIKVSKKLVN